MRERGDRGRDIVTICNGNGFWANPMLLLVFFLVIFGTVVKEGDSRVTGVERILEKNMNRLHTEKLSVPNKGILFRRDIASAESGSLEEEEEEEETREKYDKAQEMKKIQVTLVPPAVKDSLVKGTGAEKSSVVPKNENEPESNEYVADLTKKDELGNIEDVGSWEGDFSKEEQIALERRFREWQSSRKKKKNSDGKIFAAIQERLTDQCERFKGKYFINDLDMKGGLKLKRVYLHGNGMVTNKSPLILKYSEVLKTRENELLKRKKQESAIPEKVGEIPAYVGEGKGSKGPKVMIPIYAEEKEVEMSWIDLPLVPFDKTVGYHSGKLPSGTGCEYLTSKQPAPAVFSIPLEGEPIGQDESVSYLDFKVEGKGDQYEDQEVARMQSMVNELLKKNRNEYIPCTQRTGADNKNELCKVSDFEECLLYCNSHIVDTASLLRTGVLPSAKVKRKRRFGPSYVSGQDDVESYAIHKERERYVIYYTLKK
eukprot:Nk52_evm29s2630 gene=Nk52_evmTU29s2630